MTFLSVVHVLCEGGWAEIGLAIIKPVVIDVIDQHIIGNFAYLAMHEVTASFACSVDPMSRVVRRAPLGGEPLEFGKSKIIIRIDDGVLALGKRYPAEGVAVSDSPV